MRRFYDPQPFALDTPTELGAEASHHIARVLRMAVGDEISLFNGDGGEWSARISAISKKSVTAIPYAHSHDDRSAPWPVTVALPMIKGERMDYAIQKATELGAAAFQLLLTERTDVRLDGERLEKKCRHWQQVAISACEQCGLNRVPTILPPLPLTTFVQHTDADLKLIAHPGEQPLAPAQLRAASSLALLTGPEGGLTEGELAAAKEAGFIAFALGNRVLRAETAPVALLAALWTMAGLSLSQDPSTTQ